MVQPSAVSSGSMRLPKYQILLELGSGGMGQVHLAMARGPRGFLKLVVLKTLREELRGNESTYRMFLEEARISARLAHPNLVQTYEIIELDGIPTIVLEYVQGETLAHILSQPQQELGRDLHVTILTQVLAGLHAAHELRDFDGSPLNLVHRDISPHNVMLQFDGQVKVLDFGIAKTERSRVATETGILKGKIRYMAPEQLVGDKPDCRVDVFAVGVMLWEALANTKIWGELPDGDVMRALLTDSIPRLPADGNVPADLCEICHRAIAVDPEERYSTAYAFRRDLEDYLTQHGLMRSREELGDYLAQHFDEDRQRTQQLINEHIQAIEDSIRPSPQRGSNEATEVAGSQQHTAARLRGRAKRDVQTKRRRLALALGSMVLAAAGVSLWLARSPGAAAPATGRIARDLATPASIQCPSGSKLCAGTCVSLDRAESGCGAASCLQCQTPNATPRCNQQNGCDIAVCYQAYDNCDGDTQNGCETNVRVDPNNCGGCGRRCPDLPHAQRGCGDVCTIWRCQAGHRDCNGVAGDGCEVAVTNDRRNCGHCGQVCPSNSVCKEGKCRP